MQARSLHRVYVTHSIHAFPATDTYTTLAPERRNTIGANSSLSNLTSLFDKRYP